MIKSNITLEKSLELFGLHRSASVDEIKTAYRQIAKKIHPDLNPHDATARDRFNILNQAYQLLLASAQAASANLNSDATVAGDRTARSTSVRVNYVVDLTLSAEDLKLKQDVFDSLEQLIRQGNFSKAVSTIDMLVRVIPNCHEISKKQSEIYFKYAQDLITRRTQINLARTYLKESLRIDPHDRQRWDAIDREFNRIERMLK